ncbi:MAG: MmcQ/YjbR family DNA-binding protein [Bacteroidales bacterium]|nr:MmcQ/YjbR family DNA-binding protein [Bacteroidales bacterium]
MNIEEVREYCLAKPGTSEHFPFDEVTLVIKVLDKMFALLPLDSPEWLTLKCDPERAIDLRDQYADILPAFHFNKKYWNQHRFEHLPDSLVQQLIDHSYEEVVKKMPQKTQRLLSTLSNDNTP